MAIKQWQIIRQTFMFWLMSSFSMRQGQTTFVCKGIFSNVHKPKNKQLGIQNRKLKEYQQ